ncbi:preprotein translocase subunit SecA [Candidatus Parcubacteria bacterium]|nr:preprotein translocase subunit SecA [Candidatus Parcubacteria bacterium]
MSILDKVFGNANEKYLKKIQPLVEKINNLESEFEGFSNIQLKEKTKELKERIGQGKTLDDLLPDAFALVRESSKRMLSQRHFDVQLIGGIVLHQGKITEMKTGEGKTLAATLPAYLNALEGMGVHIITVNDYLAKRDAVWMGQIYDLLGLSVGCIVHEAAYIYDSKYTADNQGLNGERDKERDLTGAFRVVESYLRPASRKEAYLADIVYGTNNEFGFDYLRDNMAYSLDQMTQTRETDAKQKRETDAKNDFNFAIIDEVDSILIDEARTPLIISAPDTESSKWYQEFAKIIPRLDQKTDYEIDEKIRAVTLTEQGINKIEKILGMENIYEDKGIRYLHHLEQSLRGETLFKKDKDYIIKDGQVVIVDEFTGRLMPGRRWSGGLHQAIEAKERVEVKPESLTLASVTFQNYFRLYKKLAGMTGTAVTSAEEFDKVYGIDVIIIPTNKPMIRQDLKDKVFKTKNGRYKAVVEEIKKRHQQGQPVLVGTTSIEKNEYLGKLLEREGVSCQILNAKNHEQEGQIIAQAGKLGNVTVATNMAGRGVDIVLGGNPLNLEEAKKIKELGGLCVIGTERHEARRIDNQLRGRTGRQGDAGSSQFFISLEDNLLRVFGGDKIKGLMEKFNFPEDEPIEMGIISGAIESAQTKIEGFNFDLRKHILEYDDVMNKHREVIYKKRREILKKVQESLKPYVLEIIKKAGHSEGDYENKEKEVGEENMRQLEKAVVLRTLDMLWMEHLENMERLRDSVRLRAYGQQDPLIEYKNEGHKMFRILLDTLEANIADTIFKARLTRQPAPPEFSRPSVSSSSAIAPAAKNAKKVGRNDPCPCGSGKKYKKCCGK